MRGIRSAARRTAVALAVATVCSSTLAAAPGDSSAADRPANTAEVGLVGSAAGGFHLTGQRRVANGSYETTWTDGHGTIEATTGEGAKVRVTRESDAMRVDVTPAAEAEARDLAAAVDPEPGDPIGEPVCVDLSAEDGKVTSTGCVQRRFDADTEDGRYVVDETQQISVAEDESRFFVYNLTKTETELSYEGGAKIYKKAPATTEDLDCSDLTIGFDGESGFNFSWTKPICGSTFGPVAGLSSTTFGYAWKAADWPGGPADEGQAIEVVGAPQVFIPASTVTTRTLTVSVDWMWQWCPGITCDWS